MTPRQAECFEYVWDFCKTRGYSPCYREIMEAMNYKTKSNVHRLLTALAEQGLIIKFNHRARAIWPAQLPQNR